MNEHQNVEQPPVRPVEQAPEFVSSQSFDRLSAAFENSARRWELIVYPSLFAFILLAGYGFYLVYSLAKDVHYLAISVDTNMTVLAGNMQSVSENMGRLTRNVNEMTLSINSIDTNVGTLEPMLSNMRAIERSLESMTWATHYMRGDMSRMNQNISRPMSFVNRVMPW
jgi:hypothetical protein